MTGPLTKLDVARRQLATAIRLCFDGADPISVFSLAANAWEVIDVLCMLAGVASASAQTRGHLTAGEDLRRDYINSPFRNFFKHADRDPDGLVKGFESSAVDPVLFWPWKTTSASAAGRQWNSKSSSSGFWLVIQRRSQMNEQVTFYPRPAGCSYALPPFREKARLP